MFAIRPVEHEGRKTRAPVRIPRGHTGAMARTKAISVDHHAAWRALPACGRALVIRSQADDRLIAIEQQHERIEAWGREVFERGLLNLPRGRNTRGRIDADFFLISVRRLRRVCDLAQHSALPASASLRQPVKEFAAQVHPVIPVRDYFEHQDQATIEGRTGLGIGVTPQQLTITYAGATLDTAVLLDACRQVHRAIRAVVDPIAVDDVHYVPPQIDLAGPELTAADGPEVPSANREPEDAWPLTKPAPTPNENRSAC